MWSTLATFGGVAGVDEFLVGHSKRRIGVGPQQRARDGIAHGFGVGLQRFLLIILGNRVDDHAYFVRAIHESVGGLGGVDGGTDSSK